MPAEIIADEIDLMREVVPLEGARLLELGCGKAELARRLLERGGVASIVAMEVDTIQHAANLAAPATPGLEFLAGGAQEIPLADASLDGVLMLKSLHHVPMPLLDRALAEVHRVLRPGGWLYVSEPVYAGDFNDILRLFHDEGVVRAAAIEALERAAAAKLLEPALERSFMLPRAFLDYDDFVRKVVHATHTQHAYPEEVASQVRERFARHQAPGGARFLQPMRVNVLRRAAA